jgi:hypothetical protein
MRISSPKRLRSRTDQLRPDQINRSPSTFFSLLRKSPPTQSRLLYLQVENFPGTRSRLFRRKSFISPKPPQNSWWNPSRCEGPRSFRARASWVFCRGTRGTRGEHSKFRFHVFPQFFLPISTKNAPNSALSASFRLQNSTSAFSLWTSALPSLSHVVPLVPPKHRANSRACSAHRFSVQPCPPCRRVSLTKPATIAGFVQLSIFHFDTILCVLCDLCGSSTRSATNLQPTPLSHAVRLSRQRPTTLFKCDAGVVGGTPSRCEGSRSFRARVVGCGRTSCCGRGARWTRANVRSANVATCKEVGPGQTNVGSVKV